MKTGEVIDDNGVFELCPYGIWNLTRGNKRRLQSVFELCPYGIWNTHAWLFVSLHMGSFELCPYGIWNLFSHKQLYWKHCHLNFVPMGFETSLYYLAFCLVRYLNFVPMGFETQLEWGKQVKALDLNFVPMGFETPS